MEVHRIRPFALAAVLVVVVAAIYLMMQPGGQASIGEGPQALVVREYDNTLYGLHFTYPDTYRLTEGDAASGTPRYVITLADRVASANLAENGEGPTTITVVAFSHQSKPLERWIRENEESNFKRAIGNTLATSSVDHFPALVYAWDGSYRGESVVLQATTTTFLFSVTYASSSDPILKDFRAVLSSVLFK